VCVWFFWGGGRQGGWGEGFGWEGGCFPEVGSGGNTQSKQEQREEGGSKEKQFLLRRSALAHQQRLGD
jgi:hypothetical protein